MANMSQPLCSSPGYDPEWWSVEHDACGSDCVHRFAAHVCAHCPFMDSCQAEVMANPHLWVGMIMGGLLVKKPATRHYKQYKVTIVPEIERCGMCTPSRQLAPVG